MAVGAVTHGRQAAKRHRDSPGRKQNVTREGVDVSLRDSKGESSLLLFQRHD